MIFKTMILNFLLFLDNSITDIWCFNLKLKRFEIHSHIISWHLYEISRVRIIVLILGKKTLGTVYLFLKPEFIGSDYKECLESKGGRRETWGGISLSGFLCLDSPGGLMESTRVPGLIRDFLPPLRAQKPRATWTSRVLCDLDSRGLET